MWRAVRLSEISYVGSAASRTTSLTELGLTGGRLVTRGRSSQALFANDTARKFRWVAIRGTEQFPDMLNDMRVGLDAPSWSSRLRVHKGFLSSANELWNDVKAEAQLAERNGETLIITGHSLGGAVAQILGHRLRSEGIALHSVITFGAPRVGDAAWAGNYQSAMASRTHRIAHGDDVVPCLPANTSRFRASTTWSYRLTTGAISGQEGDFCVRLPSLADLDPTKVTEKLRGQCNRIKRGWHIAIGIFVGPTPCFNPAAIVIEGSINTALALATGSTSDHKIERYVAAVKPIVIAQRRGDVVRITPGQQQTIGTRR